MNHVVRLNTKRLYIKTLRLSDVCTRYVDGLNDEDVKKYLIGPRQVFQTNKTVRDFVKGNIQASNSLLLGLFDRKKDILIGTLRVHDINRFHFSCGVGICLFDKDYWGQGLAKEALMGVVDFVFKDLGLHYIEAGIYQGNHASVALFKSCGFEKVATYKDKYRYDTGFKPIYVFGRKNTNFNMKLLHAV